jgi:hypothetical protein
MKNNLFKIYFLSFFLLSDFILFAQPPGEDDDGGILEDDDAPASPINTKIIWLLVLAIVFAAYTYRKHRKTA